LVVEMKNWLARMVKAGDKMTKGGILPRGRVIFRARF
jgi:hypothetical protein